MQTFLPSADFERSARVLDQARLQKQLVESYQIMKAITDPTYGWQNHPAIRMWRGHPVTLLYYQRACCDEWRRRGFETDLDIKTEEVLSDTLVADGITRVVKPPAWLGHEEFHRSHRSNLVRKRPELYAMQFPDADPDEPYVWPVGRAGTLIYYRGHEPKAVAS